MTRRSTAVTAMPIGHARARGLARARRLAPGLALACGLALPGGAREARAFDVLAGAGPADYAVGALPLAEAGAGAQPLVPLDPTAWLPAPSPAARSEGGTTVTELGAGDVAGEGTRADDAVRGVLEGTSAVDLRLLASPALRDALAAADGDRRDLGAVLDDLAGAGAGDLGETLDDVLGDDGLLDLEDGPLIDVLDDLSDDLLDDLTGLTGGLGGLLGRRDGP